MPRATVRSRVTPRQLALAEKDQRAVALRAAGYSLADICAELGWSAPSSASRAIERVMAKGAQAAAQDMRGAIAAELSELYKIARQHVEQGDGKSGDWYDRAERTQLAIANLMGSTLKQPQEIRIDSRTINVLAAQFGLPVEEVVSVVEQTVPHVQAAIIEGSVG